MNVNVYSVTAEITVNLVGYSFEKKTQVNALVQKKRKSSAQKLKYGEELGSRGVMMCSSCLKLQLAFATPPNSRNCPKPLET